MDGGPARTETWALYFVFEVARRCGGNKDWTWLVGASSGITDTQMLG